MADTKKLHDMLDSLIDDNGEKAQVDFHTYLSDKMKETLANVQNDADVVDVESK